MDFKKLTLLAMLIAAPLFANAGLVVDLYGDKDGLGIGTGDGQSFNYRSIRADDAADSGTLTDRWMSGDKSWTHTYDLTGLGSITGASFELFTGGQGYRGLSSLYIDDQLVGQLTDGDGFDGGDRRNRGRLDVFDLSAHLAKIDGASTVRVDILFGGDGWALDYSELIIHTADAAKVPEPSALLLLGLALFGLARARHR